MPINLLTEGAASDMPSRVRVPRLFLILADGGLLGLAGIWSPPHAGDPVP
jgi:hypothetical protein